MRIPDIKQVIILNPRDSADITSPQGEIAFLRGAKISLRRQSKYNSLRIITEVAEAIAKDRRLGARFAVVRAARRTVTGGGRSYRFSADFTLHSDVSVRNLPFRMRFQAKILRFYGYSVKKLRKILAKVTFL